MKRFSNWRLWRSHRRSSKGGRLASSLRLGSQRLVVELFGSSETHCLSACYAMRSLGLPGDMRAQDWDRLLSGCSGLVPAQEVLTKEVLVTLQRIC